MKNKEIDYTAIDYKSLKEGIKQVIRRPLQEKDQAEIDAEKQEMDARIKQTQAQIQALTKKLGILKQKQADINKQKPDETGA